MACFYVQGPNPYKSDDNIMVLYAKFILLLNSDMKSLMKSLTEVTDCELGECSM